MPETQWLEFDPNQGPKPKKINDPFFLHPEEVFSLMPDRESIPKDFWGFADRSPWVRFVS